MMKFAVKVACTAACAAFVFAAVPQANAEPYQIGNSQSSVDTSVFEEQDIIYSNGGLNPLSELITVNSTSDIWTVKSISDRVDSSNARVSMNRVSLSLSSNSSKNITICATATSNGIINKMGIQNLKLQRYYKGKWLTVYNVSNQYSYQIARFVFTTTRYNMISGGYYRVTATFLSDTGSNITTVTRTSGTIVCR